MTAIAAGRPGRNDSVPCECRDTAGQGEEGAGPYNHPLSMKIDRQREGWLGEDYVRIFAETDRARIARLYAFGAHLPDYEPWGSWGLDSLCLGHDGKLYLIPWIPLDESHRKERYASIAAFDADLAVLHEATTAYEHFGKEIHFVTPIIFGGSPKDPENLKMIDQKAHAEVSCFWNQTYARIKK
jgi:hypothetical protein